MKRINCWALVLLTVILVIGVWSVSAFASSPTPVDPSDTLEVSIKTTEGMTVLHTYDSAEMSDLAKGNNIKYSSIDNMPATVRTIATGVYIEDLLDDIQQYTDIDVWEFYKLRFISTDGAKGIFTYDDLFEDRYYFSSLHEDGHGLDEDGEITYDVGEGTLVKPMLSIDAEQERLPSPSGDDRGVYYPEQYTILFGMSESELDNVEKMTSDYKRGVCQLVIDMGSYSVPTSDTVSGITLDQSMVTIAVGKKLQLTATISPSTAANKNVNWTTSDATVATVSSEGLVTGISSGTVTITAISEEDISISSSCKITVSQPSSGGSNDIEVSGISLNKSKLTLAVGGSSTLIATVTPSNATDRNVDWESSNTEIVSVDDDGTVKGLKEGVANITATAGNYEAACTSYSK